MSTQILDSIQVPENAVRDYHEAYSQATSITTEVLQRGAVGLDLFLRNRGAAACTVAVDGQTAMTVDAGDVYTLNGVKFNRVVVTTAVTVDFEIFGVKLNTLRGRGLFPGGRLT